MAPTEGFTEVRHPHLHTMKEEAMTAARTEAARVTKEEEEEEEEEAVMMMGGFRALEEEVEEAESPKPRSRRADCNARSSRRP